MSEPSLPGRTDRRVRHGMFGHPLYKTWDGMMSRTTRQNDPCYHLYGGRGITVCERWRDPRLFVADILRDLGPRPEGLTLDRIDNDGNYEPGNVRWATRREQRANQRASLTVGPKVAEFWQGKPYRSEICEQCGTEYQTRAVTTARFCSKKCKAKHRRDSGVDNVERACHVCGGLFTANRYDKTTHCGQSCAARCQHAGGCHPR